MDIRITAKLPATPRAASRIYRLKPPKINERTVRALARRLGLNEKTGVLQVTDEAISYANGHLALTVYRASGGIRFIDRSRWQVDDGTSNLDIDDAAATRLAQGVIRTLRLAPAAELKLLKTARLRVGEATVDGKDASERTIDVAVAMQRLVDRLPVDGPGGKVIVYLDVEGRMTGIERIWREKGGAHSRGGAWRPPERAIEDLAAHYRTRQGFIDVQEVRAGYFEEGWRSAQRFLQPAYVILGTIGAAEQGSRRRLVYVTPALVRAVGRITPPLARKPAQRRRSDGRRQYTAGENE